MKVKLRKVGNSFTLTLPGEYVAELGLSEGSDLNVVVREDRVVYEPATDTWDALREKLRRQASVQGIDEEAVKAAVEDIRSTDTSQ